MFKSKDQCTAAADITAGGTTVGGVFFVIVLFHYELYRVTGMGLVANGMWSSLAGQEGRASVLYHLRVHDKCTWFKSIEVDDLTP